jgi:spermidine synthase
VAFRRNIFLGIYAASGAAALLYEITWTRVLTLVMGHTVAAASTVLAVLMGGMGVGSWLGGWFEEWLGPKPRREKGAVRLRSYAALEVLVAASAWLVPAVLAAFVPLLKWAYEDGLATMRFGAARAAVSIAALAVPAMAMGAMFPIAASWSADTRLRSRHPSSPMADAGAVYAVNTAGAAIGALAAGLWLIPAIGVRATTAVGGTLNLAAAIGALLLARAGTQDDTAGAEPRTRPSRTPPVSRPSDARPSRPVIAWVAAGVSGFVALVYEVAWTRLLVLVVGPTTYAFAIVVASFIIGIAVGSAAGTRLVRRSSNPTVWLGGTLAFTAVAASAAGWFAATRLPIVIANAVANPSASFGAIFVGQAFGIVVLLLPTGFALGAAFPLALATASAAPLTLGSEVARVYVANTAGAIAGALLGGFVLLPVMGLQGTFRTAAWLGIAAAVGVWLSAASFKRPARGRAAATAALALGGVLTLLLPSWDLSLLASGAYKYAPYFTPADLDAERRAWSLLFYKDGASSSVAVREVAGMRSLVIDGKVDASNRGDMLTQRLLGLLPVLLHQNPQDVCIIGLGSGVTGDAALATGSVRRVDVVEVSPEVVKASAFFDAENGGLLKKSGVHLIVGDGRSHLRLTDRRYDVIVSEPSNPWMAGIAALFTREFFEEARGRLKPNGLICQWAHAYEMAPEDLQSIVRTFSSVFPESTMWLVGEGDLLLIGSNGSPVDPSAVERRWRLGRAPALLNDVGIDRRGAAFALLSLLAGGPAEVKGYGAGAAIQRDDRMALEYSAPHAIYGRSGVDNAAVIRQLAGPDGTDPALQSAMRDATDVSWTVAGEAELKANAFSVAYERFERAIRINSGNAEALAGLSEAAAGSNQEQRARTLLEDLAHAEPRNVNVRIELSRMLASAGDMSAAATLATEATRLAPDNPDAAEQLASVFADAGDADGLALAAATLVARFPGRDKGRYYNATARFLKGRPEEAIAEIRPVVAREPHDWRAQNLLGVACATVGLRDCALSAFTAAASANPRDPGTYVNLGLFYLQGGNPAEAVQNFSVALALDRTLPSARQGLADAQSALRMSH